MQNSFFKKQRLTHSKLNALNAIKSSRATDNMESIVEFAKMIIAAGAHRVVLSGPRGEKRYRKSTFLLVNEQYFIERLTEKQAFHEYCGREAAAERICLDFEGFTQINAWNGEREFTARLTKKGKLLTGSHACASAPKTVESQNRKKKYILAEGTVIPPLVDMGVMTKSGEVHKPMFDKFKQINRFLEFIDEIIDDETSGGESGANDPGNVREPMRIIDFGCGKSYLTFIVYYYFTFIRKIPVQMIGVDLKADVIEFCTGLAEKYGYSNLHFKAGDIADCAAGERIDMVITLHACDIATDYALYNAIKRGARYILSVPCCQHELASAADYAKLPIFDDNGILRERVSALITDSVRQKLLTACGYKTGLMEFVDLSHTPKNLLLRAKKAKLPESTRRAALKTVEDTLAALNTEQKLHELLKKDGYIE